MLLPRILSKGHARPYAVRPRPPLSPPHLPPRLQSPPRFQSSATEPTPPDSPACVLTDVQVNNTSHPTWSEVMITAPDYPGVLRVLTWVLNGLDLNVESARLEADEDGIITDTFWVTDRRGQKLREKDESILRDTIQEHVLRCAPQVSLDMQASILQEGPVIVSNVQDAESTVIIVRGERNKPGLLMELVATLTGAGMNTRRAMVQPICDFDWSLVPEEFHASMGVNKGQGDCDKGRIFSFHVVDRSGRKLDYSRASAILYTLGIMMGRGVGSMSAGSLTPPQPHMVKAPMV